jgi:hypothetical protein
MAREGLPGSVKTGNVDVFAVKVLRIAKLEEWRAFCESVATGERK